MIFATALVVLRTLLVAWLARGITAEPRAGRRRFSRRRSAWSSRRITRRKSSRRPCARSSRRITRRDRGHRGGRRLEGRYGREVRAVAAERSARASAAQAMAANRGAAPRRSAQRATASSSSSMPTRFSSAARSARSCSRWPTLVGAVSGHARVGNLRTFIARCQALEYICGFNLDRRAYTRLELHHRRARRGQRVSQERDRGGRRLFASTRWRRTPTSRSRCTASATASITRRTPSRGPRRRRPCATLAQQRFRWAFGTMQCLWKHRDLVFNPRFGALGWFSLPSIWFFQILLVALTPLVDVLLL